jgi:26S proteasome regulatory subunit N9
MRAMSLGLIRGSIDEVDQLVHVTFIKPRVLSAVQIASLRDRTAGWAEKVKSSLLFVEEHTRELFA